MSKKFTISDYYYNTCGKILKPCKLMANDGINAGIVLNGRTKGMTVNSLDVYHKDDKRVDINTDRSRLTVRLK